MTALENALRPVRVRFRKQRVARWFSIGLSVGMACALLVRAASYLWPTPNALWWCALALAGVSFVFAALAGLWPVSLMDAARKADSLGLLARAQTALMLMRVDTPIAELQRRDTLDSLKSLNTKAAMPLRFSKPAIAALGALVLVFALSFLIKNPQNELLEARAAFQEEMTKQAELVKEGADALDESDVQTSEMRKLLGDLARELRQADEPKDAYSALDKAERGMTELTRKTADDVRSAMESGGLGEVSAALEQDDAKTAEELLQKKENAAESLQNAASQAQNAAAAQALSQAAQALQNGSAAQAAAALQSALSGQNAAAAQAMALSSMARSAAASMSMSQGTALSQTLSASQLGSMSASCKSGGQNGAGSSQGAAGAGAGAGQGSSDKDGGYQDASSGAHTQGSNPASKKVADYESIYDPTRLGGAEGETNNERGQMGQGETSEAVVGTGAGSMGESVPYTSVLAEYSQTAVQAVQNADLPDYAQTWVEEYFASLN